MTICPDCQTLNRDGVRFCRNCGQPLTEKKITFREADTQPIVIRRCIQCGNPIRPGTHFCKTCGAPTSPLSSSTKPTITCPDCGAEITDESKFCKDCGKDLHSIPVDQSQLTDRLGTPEKRHPPVTPKLPKLCPNCGAELRDSAKFCKQCGAGVESFAYPDKIAADKPVLERTPTPPDRFGTGELLPKQIILDRYLILEKVAQGGMGAVYKAKDDRLGGKIVALKEMSEAAIAMQDRANILEAFNREAELLARLNHPNLVRVTDRFHEGPYHYMVMEFIEGKTLAQLIEGTKKPFAVERVLLWAEQLCYALHYLHSQQPSIIYRDLKPGNIMVVEETDQIKLIDFGIARFYKQGKSKDTIAFGTEGYAPPEQYGGGQTDARADIYALGVTLHELLTLQDPAQHIWGSRNVRTANPRVSPNLANAIEKAVQIDRRNRHQNITEMWEAISGKPARWAYPAVNVPVYSPKQETPAVVGSPPPSVSSIQNDSVISGNFNTVNFGKIIIRRKPLQYSRKLTIPPGKKVSVTTADTWVTVHPETLSSAGGDLRITIDTRQLRPGRRVRPGGLLKGWINLHTSHLVPETFEYRSSINLEYSWADNEQISIVVLIKPKGWQVLVGWLVTISLMLFELAILLSLVAVGIFWLGF
jgi:serine/threonine protein kinase/predicted amidophosphoribosyltransferase